MSKDEKYHAPAAIVTNTDTYKLKRSENSNNIYVLGVVSKDEDHAELLTVT